MKRFFYLTQRYNEDKKAEQYQTAMICATVLNANLEKFKRKKPYTPAEVLGEVEHKPEKLLETAKSLTEFYGGEVGDGVDKCQK